ncbi:hypothetical protein QQF64_023675 [Cirrhinus molitorella]|uniref:SET domain-containing protein n=1 Tax=Cirrhinus molitorella TaxID=172907 RepID=A0ABR3NJQ8_9TELE
MWDDTFKLHSVQVELEAVESRSASSERQAEMRAALDPLGYPAILKDESVGALVLHAGVNDIRLRQTEVLKRDFSSLIETVRSTAPETRIIVSGPLPTYRSGPHQDQGVSPAEMPSPQIKKKRVAQENANETTTITKRPWSEEENRAVMKEHTTAASQVAEMPLSDEQELWFDLYYSEVRPIMLKENGSDDDTAASSTGRPIYKPCKDNIPSVTCGDARRAVETLWHGSWGTPQKQLKSTTECELWLMPFWPKVWSTSFLEKYGMQSDIELFINLLLTTLVSNLPLLQYVFIDLTDKEHFGRRQLSESKLEAWIERQGWASNVPQASIILKNWTPFGTIDSASDGDSLPNAHSTEMEGLTVRDVPERGCGVLAKRDFQQGEVVCDYHGQQISRKEGLAIHASSLT